MFQKLFLPLTTSVFFLSGCQTSEPTLQKSVPIITNVSYQVVLPYTPNALSEKVILKADYYLGLLDSPGLPGDKKKILKYKTQQSGPLELIEPNINTIELNSNHCTIESMVEKCEIVVEIEQLSYFIYEFQYLIDETIRLKSETQNGVVGPIPG